MNVDYHSSKFPFSILWTQSTSIETQIHVNLSLKCKSFLKGAASIPSATRNENWGEEKMFDGFGEKASSSKRYKRLNITCNYLWLLAWQLKHLMKILRLPFFAYFTEQIKALTALRSSARILHWFLIFWFPKNPDIERLFYISLKRKLGKWYSTNFCLLLRAHWKRSCIIQKWIISGWIKSTIVQPLCSTINFRRSKREVNSLNFFSLESRQPEFPILFKNVAACVCHYLVSLLASNIL